MTPVNFLFRIGGTVIKWQGKDPKRLPFPYCDRHYQSEFILSEYSSDLVEYDENDEPMFMAIYICQACFEGYDADSDFDGDDDEDEDEDDDDGFFDPDDTLYEDEPPRFYYDAETDCYYLKPTAEEIQMRTREFFEAHGQLRMGL
jgi:hypothetical protein